MVFNTSYATSTISICTKLIATRLRLEKTVYLLWRHSSLGITGVTVLFIECSGGKNTSDLRLRWRVNTGAVFP